MAIGIRCCKDCIAPKRHPGCHATCQEYIDEKAKYTVEKAKERKAMDKERICDEYEINRL